ncbi:MAG: DUF3479 domain-containing protein [Pseudomonadota bacterium]
MAGNSLSSPADHQAVPYRVVMLSMDAHLEAPVRAAERDLRRAIPGLSVQLHAASEWEKEGPSRQRVADNIQAADLILMGMLFLEDQVKPLLPILQEKAASTEPCDGMVGILAAPELVKLTQLGKFRMDKPQNGAIGLLKRLRGKSGSSSNGENQAKILRRLPKLLKYIPGTAQDVRSYFLTMQYWLGGSEHNVRHMIAALINKYASGPRAGFRQSAVLGIVPFRRRVRAGRGRRSLWGI